MLKIFKQKVEDNHWSLWVSIGALFFFSVYGYKILDPTNVEWTLMRDAAQHFLGWSHFRNQDWSFPLGQLVNYRYPLESSIVYTDSIPLLAIFFKFFSSILPRPFQYHGFWILVCYILQVYFAMLLAKKFKFSILVKFAFVGFVISSPQMYFRAEEHEALSSHWIILAALYLYHSNWTSKLSIKWTALLCVSVGIHFYLFVMVYILYFFKFLQSGELRSKKHWSHFALSHLSCLMVMFCLGYFIIGVGSAGAGGFGYYNMNLLSPIDPHGASLFLNFSIPRVQPGQYEGYNYLGLGLIYLLNFVSIKAFPQFERLNKTIVMEKLFFYLPFVILLLLSISHKVTYSDQVILNIELPKILEDFLRIVRSSGRMFWPVYYLLMIDCFKATVKMSNRSSYKTAVFLLVLMIVQLVDLSKLYRSKDFSRSQWAVKLKIEKYEEFMKGIKHVVMYPFDQSWPVINSMSYLASYYGKTINQGLLARYDAKKNDELMKQTKTEIRSLKLNEDSLYVFHRPKYWKAMIEKFPNNSRLIEGHLFVSKKVNQKRMLRINSAKKKLKLIEFLYQQAAKKGIEVYFSVKDEASNRLKENVAKAFKNLGSQIGSLKYRGSYLGVMKNGRFVLERMKGEEPVKRNFKFKGHDIMLKSAGFKSGNESIIAIDDVNYSLNLRGLNIVVFDSVKSSIETYNFDTFKNYNPISNSP